MIEGLFIVIEGVDGAGTTTHTGRLAQSLKSQGLAVHTTHEPSVGPVGVLLRQIITGRVVVPGINGTRPPAWDTMALLFAADRLDHCEAEIVPHLMDGVTVICDRYDYSSVAYQTVTARGESGAFEWVTRLNARARRPDLTIVLRVPSEVAARRRRERGTAQDIFDDGPLQQHLADFYHHMDQRFPEHPIRFVDADRPVDDVADDILHLVKLLRGDTTHN